MGRFVTSLTAVALLMGACNGDSPPVGDTSTAGPLTTLPSVTTTTAPPAPTLPTLPPPTSLPAGTTVCDEFGDSELAGELASAELREASGLAVSRTHAGILWAHNDSGDAAAVYAVGMDGSDHGRFRLEGATALDWEDMAIGPGPGGKDHLYLGDIGDNLRLRGNLTVYRVPEPAPGRPGGLIEDVVELRVTYGEGDRGLDAEALAVDPITGDVYVVTKGDDAGRSVVFRALAGELTPDVIVLMEPVAILELGAEVTAADFSTDGGLFALRGYRSVWMWPREAVDLREVLSAEPCSAPSPVEVQGEAIAFAPDGSYYTVSEGSLAPISRVGR